MSKEIQQAGVAGAGTMGAGIAQVLAQAGIAVTVYDLSESALTHARAVIEKNTEGAVARKKMTEETRQATLQRIGYTTVLEALKADLIVEAIVEKIEVKRQLFGTLAANNSEHTLLASNTSSIPITRIAQGIARPERIAGLHFFNPAHIMKLVEIIRGVETSEATVQTLKELAVRLGKTPVLCTDSPGFIVNRVARHYYVESLKIVEEGVAPMEHVDQLLESVGFKLGPFRLMDFIGNDVNYAVTSSLFESFHYEAKFRPSRLQQQKVDAGHLGKKSGKGFYNYS